VVNFSNFRILDPEAADIARELVSSGEQRHSPFLPFMNTWMGFNGWMESVTEAGSDAAMISALADNRRMTDAYGQLLQSDPEFRRSVVAFARLWPVLNVRDVKKKLGRDAFWQFERERLIEACEQAEVKSQPQGWIPGDLPTWPQTLRTIYLVRCNLFHGAKSPQNGRDRRLVQGANEVLRRYIDGSGCFDWHDHQN
jgi:hypothetical protein